MFFALSSDDKLVAAHDTLPALRGAYRCLACAAVLLPRRGSKAGRAHFLHVIGGACPLSNQVDAFVAATKSLPEWKDATLRFHPGLRAQGRCRQIIYSPELVALLEIPE